MVDQLIEELRHFDLNWPQSPYTTSENYYIFFCRANAEVDPVVIRAILDGDLTY